MEPWQDILQIFDDLCDNDIAALDHFLKNRENYIFNFFCYYIKKKCDENIVKIFLNQNIDFTMINYSGTILHHLVLNRDITINVMKMFLEKVNINVVDHMGYTCLHNLCKYTENVDLLKYVLEQKYDINIIDKCLHQTTNYGIIKTLLEYKFNPNDEDEFHRTPLELDVPLDEKIIWLYINHGCDINRGTYRERTISTFVWTFRLQRYYIYNSEIYRTYCRRELDFRDPRLDRGLKRIARELLRVFKRLRVTRHIAYICLDYVFNNL
jgi:ankyrin repeat protein